MNLFYGRIRNLVGGFKALHDVCKKQAPGHCSVLQTLLSCPVPQEGLKIKGSNIGPFCLYSYQNLDEQLTPQPPAELRVPTALLSRLVFFGFGHGY